MKPKHLLLFSRLISDGRVSIREKNESLSDWDDLQEAGLCTILRAGRAGTVVIHSTAKALAVANHFLIMME